MNLFLTKGTNRIQELWVSSLVLNLDPDTIVRFCNAGHIFLCCLMLESVFVLVQWSYHIFVWLFHSNMTAYLCSRLFFLLQQDSHYVSHVMLEDIQGQLPISNPFCYPQRILQDWSIFHVFVVCLPMSIGNIWNATTWSLSDELKNINVCYKFKLDIIFNIASHDSPGLVKWWHGSSL